MAMTLQRALPGLGVDTYPFSPLQATFQGGSKEPFRRWYPYLEGYAPEFVENVLALFAPDAQSVLDPFGGTATTAFFASQRGLSAYVCEVNPVMQFIFEVKTRVLSLRIESREALYKRLLVLRGELSERLESSQVDEDLLRAYSNTFGSSRFFTQETFLEVLRARSLADEVGLLAAFEAQLLTVAILASLVPCSLLKRSGDVRYKTEAELARGVPAFVTTVLENFSNIADDVNCGNGALKTTPLLICEDSRSLKAIPSLQVGAVITSPPYINGTNYFRNTKLELWFLRCLKNKGDLGAYRYRAVTAGINDVTVEKSSLPHHPSVEAVVKQLEADAYDSRIPRMVASYFSEMSDIFAGIRQHLKESATVAIDIGDSIYGGVHVPADQLLVNCLTDLGYTFREDVELRKRRSKNGELLRQALLVFNYSPPRTRGVTTVPSTPRWGHGWTEFQERLPHQEQPYAKRNWGNAVHSLCSYQGKLKPAIAHHLVKIFVPEGGSVLDPFAGVGTIPFEAALQGKKAFGLDLSPTAYAISSAKLRITETREAREVLQRLAAFIPTYVPSVVEWEETRTFGFNKKLVDYYHPDTLREILAARRFFQLEPKSPSVMLVEAVCMHILHGNRPYALSRRSHPITPYAPSGEFEYRSLIPRLSDKLERALHSELPAEFVAGNMYLQDGTAWWPLEIASLDAVITSPPFFDSTRFYLANWLRLWFSGWTATDFVSQPLSFVDERQKESFLVYEPILRQARERLKPGGVLVMHLGKSNKCDMATELIKVANRWFSNSEVFDESVAHCESHGIRDKGTVTAHQYLVLY